MSVSDRHEGRYPVLSYSTKHAQEFILYLQVVMAYYQLRYEFLPCLVGTLLKRLGQLVGLRRNALPTIRFIE
jgi:hypothetical protein